MCDDSESKRGKDDVMGRRLLLGEYAETVKVLMSY
jgi:hypothetical protein